MNMKTEGLFCHAEITYIIAIKYNLYSKKINIVYAHTGIVPSPHPSLGTIPWKLLRVSSRAIFFSLK